MKKKTVKYLLHWCHNTRMHRNGQPHSYYVRLGKLTPKQWLSVKFRTRNAVAKACPACGKKSDVAVGRIVIKEKP